MLCLAHRHQIKEYGQKLPSSDYIGCKAVDVSLKKKKKGEPQQEAKTQNL